jgi:hypothetical protein
MVNFQSDPSLYRHNKKRGSRNVSSVIGNSSTQLAAITANTAHEGLDGYAGVYQSTTKETTYRQSSPILEPYRKVADVKTPNTLQRLLQRMLKLKEIATLAQRYYPTNTAGNYNNCQFPGDHARRRCLVGENVRTATREGHRPELETVYCASLYIKLITLKVNLGFKWILIPLIPKGLYKRQANTV